MYKIIHFTLNFYKLVKLVKLIVVILNVLASTFAYIKKWEKFKKGINELFMLPN